MTMVSTHHPTRLVIDTPGCHIYQGKAEHWRGEEPIDFVFTNPYGYLPGAVIHLPMIIHQWVHRRQEAETWCGNRLDMLVSTWNLDREAFWCANVAHPVALNLRSFSPEQPGWYPEELVRRVFDAYIRPGWTVWDGFMGRGTIAKVAREHGVRYVGVEMLPQHIAIAQAYLGLNDHT